MRAPGVVSGSRAMSAMCVTDNREGGHSQLLRSVELDPYCACDPANLLNVHSH